jgi:hypothetical protein
MLLILLSVSWLATILVVVGICRMAARGDEQLAVSDRKAHSNNEGQAPSENPAGLVLADKSWGEGAARLTVPGA